MKDNSRKQGTTLILTIPSQYHVKEHQAFEVKQLSDGTLLFHLVNNDNYPPI